jgi:hypothetical protein
MRTADVPVESESFAGAWQLLELKLRTETSGQEDGAASLWLSALSTRVRKATLIDRILLDGRVLAEMTNVAFRQVRLRCLK